MSNNNTASNTEEDSKVAMEDLTIQENDNQTQNTSADEAEMSLEERMNWLRERVRDFLVCIDAICTSTD
jgi:hypothetical protein